MLAFIGLCMLLLVGHWLRTRLRLLQWMYLPACVIAGLVGLGLVAGINALMSTVPSEGAVGWQAWVVGVHAEVSTWTAMWGKLPGFLINVVFACLFMGVRSPVPQAPDREYAVLSSRVRARLLRLRRSRGRQFRGREPIRQKYP